MPTVSVYPGNPVPTHDISLSDGREQFGLLLERGEISLQETPMTPPARSFSTEQASFTGGRGKVRFATDQLSFFDSKNLWTLQDEVAYPSPRAEFATGIRTAHSNMPTQMAWIALRGDQNTVAVKFTPTSTFAAQNLWLWIRKIGAPFPLTVQVRTDNAGSPSNTNVVNTTVTGASIDEVSRFYKVAFSSTSFTAGATYWILMFYGPTSTSSYWEFGAELVDDSITKKANNGITWSAATFTPYFRIAATTTEREYLFFQYLGGLMAVTKPKPASGSQLFINGDIGKATAGAATTITDSAKTWTVNGWAGAWVRIVSGKGSGQARQISSNTATALTVSDWDEQPDSTSRYAIYSTPKWTEITGHGLTKVVNKPLVVGNTIYFPQGDSVNIRRARYDTSWAYADDGTNKADIMVFHKDNIYKGLDTVSGSLLNQLQYAPTVTWSTNLTFTGDIKVGTGEYLMMSALEFDGVLYIVKQDSVWKIVNNVAYRLNLGIEAVTDMQNGKNAIAFGPYLYFPLLHSIEQLQGSTLNDIGWWRHDGMPSGRDGQCSDMVGAINWLFACMDGGNKYSALMCYNMRGWHELFRSYNAGERIRNVYWQTCPESNPILWFSYNNEIMYIRFPANSLNPLKDSTMTYHNEGVLITASLDAGNPTYPKIVRNVVVESVGLSSTEYIGVDYQINENVGSDSWKEAGNIYTSPTGSVTIEDGEVRSLRLRFRIISRSGTSAPRLISYQINGHIIEPVKYQWNMRIKVAANQKTKTGTQDHKPDELRKFLQDCASEMRLLRMRSGHTSMDDRAVYVSAPTILRSAANLLSRTWDGTMVVTIREA